MAGFNQYFHFVKEILSNVVYRIPERTPQSNFIHNIALILPPSTDAKSIASFAPDEVERLFLDGEAALICLYMGNLARAPQSIFEA